MFLYIKYDHRVFKVSNIYLERCLDPNVGNFIQGDIDPTLWFKALVLDSVFVDCDICERHVFWRSVTHETHVDKEQPDDHVHIHETDEEALTVELVRAYFRNKGIFDEFKSLVCINYKSREVSMLEND